MKKKIGIVITDGVGYKNFILSDFISSFKKNQELHILSCLPIGAYDQEVKDKAKIHHIPEFRESLLIWTIRRAKELSHLRTNLKHNYAFEFNYKKQLPTNIKGRNLINFFLYYLLLVINFKKLSLFFEKYQYYLLKKNNYTKKIENLILPFNLSVLFFTHQRPSFISPILSVAKKAHITTSTFIFSWDNLSTKGRMAGAFSDYLVWSDLMAKELHYFYPEVDKEKIHVVGTPQFEHYYMDKFKVEKEEFLAKFDIGKDKKILCYSCGDVSTSRNDVLYIQILAEAIEKGFIKNVVLLVRTSPAEDNERFKKVISKHKNIRWNFPKWEVHKAEHQELWSQRISTKEDQKDMYSIIRYSDININMLSTMSLDFMCYDKPVVNPVFGNEKNGLYNDQRFLRYNHIAIMTSFNATRLAFDEQSLIESVNLYLENSNLDSENRQELLKTQISKPIPGTAQRIADLISSF